MKHLLTLQLSIFFCVGACASSSESMTPDAGATEDQSDASTIARDADRLPDASTTPNDAATASDAGADAAASLKRCGHGTFTQADAVAACAVPNWVLDNSAGKRPRYCDGATISSGTWEVWCGTGPILVKVMFNGLTATSAHKGCFDFTETKVVSGWIEHNGAGSGMTPVQNVPQAFDVAKPINAELKSLGNTQSDAKGTGNIFLVGEFPAACGAATGTQAVMSGVAFSWDAATGN